MKRIFLSLILVSLSNLSVMAQSAKFGYLNVDSLLKSLPDYQNVEKQMQQLGDRYKAETDYNEQTFRRQYAEFLQGQKQFTPNIMAKRQADLQQSLEQNMKFRQQADSLLNATRAHLLATIRQRLNNAIRMVGEEQELEYILDTSFHNLPYVNPQVSTDVTELVIAKLKNK